jgi:hypothetical protein
MANGLVLRYILLVSLLFVFSHADKVLKKTLACPSVVLLQKALQEDMKDPLNLEMYAIANNCVILDKSDEIEAIGYDPRNSKEIYQQILRKKTGRELYLLRSTIAVEQGGKKDTMRF